ncbi:MAG TPA: nucleoside recognition domain-containing protein, partial [Bacteroidales bacterium]|nr:nucleoside recognition domain-containing protein [Bacteroidales bacterium]
VDRLRNERHKSGERLGQLVYTPLSALSFMIFVLLYFPCLGTIAVISRESGSWKWGAFTILYTSGLAYVVSLLFFQIGSLLGF